MPRSKPEGSGLDVDWRNPAAGFDSADAPNAQARSRYEVIT